MCGDERRSSRIKDRGCRTLPHQHLLFLVEPLTLCAMCPTTTVCLSDNKYKETDVLLSFNMIPIRILHYETS